MAKVESEKWLQEHKPTLTVDIAGANRFISAAIPELRPEQKQALCKVRDASFDLQEGYIPYAPTCASTALPSQPHLFTRCRLRARNVSRGSRRADMGLQQLQPLTS